jgi:hypothetical protein
MMDSSDRVGAAHLQNEVVTTRPQFARTWRAGPFYVRYSSVASGHWLNHCCSDMSLQKDIFDNTLELFDSEQEDIRAAAAFAAGQ